MEDHYTTLEVEPTATQEELKLSYRSKLLRVAPDKVSADRKEEAHTQFIALQKAWGVLSDPIQRADYDVSLQRRIAARSFPVQDTISLDDFDFDGQYTYPCRCGEYYSLTTIDVSFKMDFCACPGCSLCVKITYPKHQ